MINSIINLTTIKKFYQNYHNKSIPLSNQTIKNILIKNSNYFKNKLSKEIFDLIKIEKKFCLYLDEWQDNSGNYFLNLILNNDNKTINLGLININFSLNAELLFNIIKNKLHQFSIDIEKDIIGIVTDGCPLMACISKYFQGPQILCFAHLLHFSVTKTFFSNYKIIENNKKN